jgi:hypothetical protein
MENSTTKKTKRSFLTYYAQGLVTYATRSSAFSEWLAARVPVTGAVSVFDTTDLQTHSICIPTSDERALERAQWVLEMIRTKSLSGHKEAEMVLQQWAQSIPADEPKAIILGVMLGYDPVGLWGNPKTKNRPMDLVMSSDIVCTKEAHKLLKYTTPLTHRVVEFGLKEAKGQTQRLEPELASWLFGDHALALYSGTRQTLNKLKEQLERLSVPHATHIRNEEVVALAITPAVDVRDLEHAQHLKTIQT